MASQWTTEDLLERLTQLVERNAQDTSSLIGIGEQQQRTIEVLLNAIQSMQLEIRGLQTENRRIMDQLINRDRR